MKKLFFALVFLALPFNTVFAEDIKIDFSAIDEFIAKEGSAQLISFDLQDVPLSQVVKILAKKSGLNLILQRDLADKPVSIYMQDVDIKDAIKMLVESQGLVLEQQGGRNLFVIKDIPKEGLVTKVFRLRHATVPGAKILSKSNDSGDDEDDEDEEGEGGLSGKSLFAAVESALSKRGTAVCDPRTNSIIVKDTPQDIKNIENIINKLDIEVPQVTIEVDMLDVAKTVIDNLGMDWSGTATYEGGSRSTSFPLKYSKYPSAERDDNFPGIGWSGVTLRALLSDKHTRYLARPKIFTLSGETANIKIMADEVVGLVVTKSDTSADVVSEEAERHNIGVSLEVTPYVSLDKREITMVINPKIVEAKDSDYTSYIGNSYKDPEERGIRSVVRVPDGETIVLGGLIKRKDSSEKKKVPFLGDILGPLFSYKSGDNIDRELLIFITPKILDEFDKIQKEIPAAKEREKEIKSVLDEISVTKE